MENQKRIETIGLIAKLVLILSIPLYLVVKNMSDKEDQMTAEADYVGAEACIECHNAEYDQWKTSDHFKAMALATDSTVVADFNDVSFESMGLTHRFYRDGEKFMVTTDGASGELEDFEIKYVFGYYPLQQFLVEFPGGRLQTLQLTWNCVDSVWYSMVEMIYADEDIDSDNWLHWTNQAQNWNSMCADCHSTELLKNYDPETDTYNTTWSEINVSCEACHGPASEHIRWANRAEYARPNDTNYGLVVATSGIDNKQYVDQCARCHTRRGAICDYNHSSTIYDHMMPNLPVEENYWVDGQILEEDYVYTSFTQSKMYMRDVQCNDCHNVHSTKRLFEDNRLCTQCHRASDYDTPAHHFHKLPGEEGEALIADDGVKFEVGDGARCINCHMPAQFYMGVDYRNDHSFRIPRPDLTMTLGTPNACNQCHDEESPQWAQNYIEQWYGESRKYQYGIAFREAASGSEAGLQALIEIYNDDVYPEIVRATAIEKMSIYYNAEAKSYIYEALVNSNDHIRFTAVKNYQLNDAEDLKRLLPLLKDGSSVIRIETANKLMSVPDSEIPKAYKNLRSEVGQEYLKSLRYNADFPGGKFNLANYYYNTNQLDLAEKFYKRAIEQDDQLHPIKLNLAYVYNSQGKLKEAEEMFLDYIKNVPEDGNAYYTYGLFLTERQRYDESLEYLLKAGEFDLGNPRIYYNIAMMYDFKKDEKNAEAYLLRCIEMEPFTIDYYSVLLNQYLKNGNNAKAKRLAQQVVEKFPDLENIDQIKAIANR